MAAAGTTVLARELQEGLRAVHLPFLIVYGPPLSGKTALLDGVPAICRDFAAQRPLVCLRQDFRSEFWRSPSDPLEQLCDALIETASRALPAFRRGRAGRSPRPVAETIAEIGEAALWHHHWGMVLIWDHLDILPNDGVRAICRQMKIFSESHAAVRKRIGVVAASVRNLAWLNDSKESPFLGYEPIVLPPRDGGGAAKGAAPHPRARRLVTEERLHTVITTVGLSGARRPSLPRVAESLLTHRSGLDVLRDTFLHLASGDASFALAKRLVAEEHPGGLWNAFPDYDELEETGLFVVCQSPACYRFRNALFAHAADYCIRMLEGSNGQVPPRSLASLLQRFTGCSRQLAAAETLPQALAALREAWSLVLGGPSPDYYLCFAGPDRGELGCIAETHADGWRVLNAGQAPLFFRKIRDLRSRRRYAFAYADGDTHAMWHRQEVGAASLVHVLASPRRRNSRPINESTACHIKRLFARHEGVLARLAVLEYGARCLQSAVAWTDAAGAATRTPNARHGTDSRLVFIVHGRNLAAKRQIEDLLLRLELKPIEWEAARSETGSATAPTLDIIRSGLRKARAVIVLMTGDDDARLRGEFKTGRDRTFESRLTPQPRQNVLIEAGMAAALYPTRTVLVEFGAVRPISDLAGLNTLHYDGSAKARMALALRLRDAGCSINTNALGWIS